MRKFMLAAALAAALPTASFAQSVEEGRSQVNNNFFGTTEGIFITIGSLALIIGGIVVIVTNNRGGGRNGNGGIILPVSGF